MLYLSIFFKFRDYFSFLSRRALKGELCDLWGGTAESFRVWYRMMSSARTLEFFKWAARLKVRSGWCGSCERFGPWWLVLDTPTRVRFCKEYLLLNVPPIFFLAGLEAAGLGYAERIRAGACLFAHVPNGCDVHGLGRSQHRHEQVDGLCIFWSLSNPLTAFR